MRHESLPQTMTVEQLAEWIMSNQKQQIGYEKKYPLTKEEIADHEHKSALASRKILELNDLKKKFNTLIKKGTPINDGQPMPMNVEIPPTHGLDVLSANVAFHSDILDVGHRVETIMLYLVPVPETSMMVCVDIEGEEYPEYTRPMNPQELDGTAWLFKKGPEAESGGVEYPERHFVDTDEISDVPMEEVAQEKPKQKKKKKTADKDLFQEEETIAENTESSEEPFI